MEIFHLSVCFCEWRTVNEEVKDNAKKIKINTFLLFVNSEYLKICKSYINQCQPCQTQKQKERSIKRWWIGNKARLDKSITIVKTINGWKFDLKQQDWTTECYAYTQISHLAKALINIRSWYYYNKIRKLYKTELLTDFTINWYDDLKKIRLRFWKTL